MAATVRHHDNCCNNYFVVGRRTATHRGRRPTATSAAGGRAARISSTDRFDHCRSCSALISGVIASNTARPFGGRPNQHAPAIGGVREALGETRPLEPIDEPGGVGGAVQQSVGDGPDRHPGVRVIGETQHEQRHVLGVREVDRSADRLQLVEVPIRQEQHVQVDVAAAGHRTRLSEVPDGAPLGHPMQDRATAGFVCGYGMCCNRLCETVEVG